MTPEDRARLAANLQAVRERIAAAATRAGRDPASVRLIAVTKYVESSVMRELLALGCHDLGEARPQALWSKQVELADVADSIRWHFIGHLQRNKLGRTLEQVSLLHSGDRWDLLAAADEFAAAQRRSIPALIEVNISGDGTKHGFRPDEIVNLGKRLAELKHVDVRGLMGMSSLEGDLNSARREFARLRELREQARASWPASLSLNELSMGMSGDFEVAIEEGATAVRVGSALYEGIA